MKNLCFMFIVVLTIFGGITACAPNRLADTNSNDEVLLSDDSLKESDKSSTIPSESEPPSSSKETTSSPGVPEEETNIKVDSGRYIGKADNNFIEIKISGVPDEIAGKTFMLSDGLKDSFDDLMLKTGDNIKFEYFVNKDNQNVILNIEKI